MTVIVGHASTTPCHVMGFASLFPTPSRDGTACLLAPFPCRPQFDVLTCSPANALARLLTYKSAYEIDQGRSNTMLASMVRTFCTQRCA